ncbi:MAG: hypothetical protein ACW976_06490, partial [Candidatus Ranarchaeia archaeon]
QDKVMKSKLVTSILSAQNTEGYWVHREDMYLPKYKATTHQLLILAEIGATRTPMIEKAIEHIFQFQRNSGHFLTKIPKSEKGKNSVVKDGCCFDGNVLYYLNHFGYLEDPRTKKLLEFIIDYFDKENMGWKCRAYPINLHAVFPVNCYMGATKILKAFSMIPESKRSLEMREIISQEIEKTLENRVYKYLRNSDGSRKDKAGWKRFGFPLFYQTDLLEVMDTLTRLHVKDERMQDAVDIILETQQDDGKWLLKNTYNGKMWVDIEEKNKSSKWVTLRAIRILKRLYNP